MRAARAAATHGQATVRRVRVAAKGIPPSNGDSTAYGARRRRATNRAANSVLITAETMKDWREAFIF